MEAQTARFNRLTILPFTSETMSSKFKGPHWQASTLFHSFGCGLESSSSIACSYQLLCLSLSLFVCVCVCVCVSTESKAFANMRHLSPALMAWQSARACVSRVALWLFF